MCATRVDTSARPNTLHTYSRFSSLLFITRIDIERAGAHWDLAAARVDLFARTMCQLPSGYKPSPATLAFLEQGRLWGDCISADALERTCYENG